VRRTSSRVRAPGLDGLRGLAVLAVVAFHERFSGLPGGFLGVDVFFVISGYLITDLLAAPWDLGGRPGLRGFWIRRARRLLPCLAVMLATVTAAVTVFEPDQLPALRPALVAAITYTSNWWQALHHRSYFAASGPPPPLQHLWSLAIEEQFYLCWPVLLAVILCVSHHSPARDRRRRATFVWFGAAASAVAMAAGYAAGVAQPLLYYGTGTHATALLAGSALALSLPLRRLTAAPLVHARRHDLAGLIGITVLVWEMGHLPGGSGALYLGAMALAAVASGAVVVAAASTGMFAVLLRWAPLRWIGVRSYGIYLWHWPVIALIGARSAAQPTAAWARVAETAAAIALAAASWHWIEAPIIRNGFGATIRGWLASLRSPRRRLPTLTSLAAAAVVCTAGYGVLHPPSGPSLQQQIAAGARVSAATRAQAGRGNAPPGPAMIAVTSAPAGAPLLADQPPGRTPAATGAHVPLREAGSYVTAIGDSVMLAAAAPVRATLPGIYIDAQVGRQMSQGIAVVRQLDDTGRLRPVVVVGLGTNGPVTSGQIRALIATTGPERTLVLVSTFAPRPWQAEVNAVLAGAARRDHHIVLANWFTTIRGRTGLLWDDGVHPRPPAAVLYARMLAAAVRQAISRLTGSPALSPGSRPDGRPLDKLGL
jgi:peptidoglycan/LPS O-acetylase OafA/YrhL